MYNWRRVYAIQRIGAANALNALCRWLIILMAILMPSSIGMSPYTPPVTHAEASGRALANITMLLGGWFYVPVLAFLPFALLFAIFWRRPCTVLLLRPFAQRRTAKRLRKLIRYQLSAVGHVYTLSDTHVRLRWLTWLPWLGLLPFVTFRHQVTSVSDLEILKRRINRKFVRTLTWFYARDKVFAITSDDRVWTDCVEALMLAADFIIIDLTGFHDSVSWELDHAVTNGFGHKIICIVEDQEQNHVRWLLLARYPMAELLLIPYNRRSIEKRDVLDAILARTA